MIVLRVALDLKVSGNRNEDNRRNWKKQVEEETIN